MSEQQVHQGALLRQFSGREKLLSGAVEMVEQAQAKGGVVVIEGGTGEGKTVFMVILRTETVVDCQFIRLSENGMCTRDTIKALT